MEILVTVGDALLSSSLEMLFNKLTSSELLNFARKEEILANLMEWKTMLPCIQAVLEDAEEKQITNHFVKNWLGELRDVAYDVEDIMDDFETEALRRKLKAESQASTSKILKLIPTCCTCLNPSDVQFGVEMGSKIKDISTTLERIIRQKDVLNLREITGRRSNGVSYNRPTSSLPEANFFGREREKEAIVELLLSGEASDAQLSVIPIQGMGGIGKTTLAQLVYNDPKVINSFDLKSWVCVSDNFDVPHITRTILQSDASDINFLQEKLKEKLTGKKFLIVLDDVWNENYLKWTDFRRPLEAGAPGSRIIVTTRNQGVSSTMGSVPVYPLKELPNDDCLSLFAQHALGARNFDAHPNLKDIGEQMVHKCKGLPLAAKALGGLLCSEREYAKWEDVLLSKIWDEEQSGILPVLRLSYHHLPSHLKRCFACCAMFPKDFEFDKDELIFLWMAEGFLEQPKRTKQMENIGLEYFDDLLSRSFFQRSSSNKSRFVMHDLLHDLAQSIFGEICFNYEDNLQGNKHYTSLEKVRYSSFKQEQFHTCERFNIFYGMKSLRTFLALPFSASNDYSIYLSNKVLRNLLPELKCLRVLSLSGYCIEELPDSIGDLKHLRHLNLSYTQIKCLPESVGTLYNLQTLILSSCERLTKLPSSIGNLINLRNLDISGTDSLEEMPWGISKLTSLHNLTKFIVGKGDGLGIRELKKLPHLCGQLSISGLHNVMDIRAAKDANLKDKQGLNELALEWIKDFNDSRNERDEEQVLDWLQPHKDLKKLSIAFYGGTRFPSWVGGPSFTKLEELSLIGCRKSTSLPSLGQLSLLKVLCIQDMNVVKSVGLEFLENCSHPSKAFKSLKILKFINMLEWEDWSSSNRVEEASMEEFPSLEELVIDNCPKLARKLPSHLSSLIKLEIHTCPLLENSLVTLPFVREMIVEDCNEMVLKSLVDIRSLTILKIKRISGLSCLDQGLMRFLVALEVLEIEDCNELKSLWCNEVESEKLACLRSLDIRKCPQLISLAVEEQDLHRLISLKSLQIRDCESLETLPDWVMHGNNSNQSLLEELVIERCPLKSFPRGNLPTTLKRLEIKDCENLECLPEGMMHDANDKNNTSHLEALDINGCSSLTSYPIGKFTATLQSLTIWKCTQLESLSERMLQNNTTLGSISIHSCTYLKSLPLECLTHLTILHIFNCPGIVSIPEGGLPPNLRELEIRSCENLKQPMLEWGLHALTSLRKVILVNTCPPDIVLSFPDDECLMLPTALTFICIGSNNLESISKGIQNLTSLRILRFDDCPKLRSLPKEGLPASLGRFYINNCPLLKERCLKDKGEYWSILADIPCILLP